MSHITRTLIVTSTLLIGSMWVTAQAEEPAKAGKKKKGR